MHALYSPVSAASVSVQRLSVAALPFVPTNRMDVGDVCVYVVTVSGSAPDADPKGIAVMEMVGVVVSTAVVTGEVVPAGEKETVGGMV